MDEETQAPAAEEQENKFEQIAEDQRKRAEKAEKELREIKEALETPEEKPEQLPTQDTTTQFGTLAENLSVLRNLEDSEVAELQAEAKELSIDPLIYAKSKGWKAHLETLRASKQADETTPAPSHRTAVFEGKTFAEVVSGEDSQEAKQAAFLAQRDAVLNRGRNKMI